MAAKISLHGNNSNTASGGLTATVNWPDGSTQTLSQQTIQATNPVFGTIYDVKAPIMFTYSSVVNLTSGLITNICPAGQTFNYINQTIDVNVIGMVGIQSFDNDISTLLGLRTLLIGGYYTTTTWNGVPSSPLYDNVYLTSFNTILPNSTNEHTIIITRNQLNLLTFNPTYTIKTTSLSITNNPGQTSPITVSTGHRIDRCEISYNPSLTSVTLNGTGYMRTILLNYNGLTNFTINGLNLNTAALSSVSIELEYNQLTSLPANCITSYPPLLNSVSISLKGNKLTSFDYFFTGPNMNLLNLDNQTPLYSTLLQISNIAISGTTFKNITFQNNNVSRCPILPQTLTTFNGSSNPIVAQPNLPNLTPGLISFKLQQSTGPHQSNLSNWQPDTQIETFHTPLSNISTLTTFIIQKTILPLDGWKFQFSNSIGPGTAQNPSIFSLSEATNLSTFDMLYLGSFRRCDIFTNTSLAQLENLTTRSSLTTLNIYGNKFTASDKIIPDFDPWPSSLYYLDVRANSLLSNWTKSFAGFNTDNTPASYLSFNNTALSNNSIAFIICDLVTATTLTNGSLIFSGGTGNPLPALNAPNTATLNCLNCLSASTSTPCVFPATGNGRNWTVRLRIT